MMDVEAAKALCRGFAGSTEEIKWGVDTAFSVGGKMFARLTKKLQREWRGDA